MAHIFAIMAGGALGSLARYGVSILVIWPGMRFPYNTLIANVLGSFLLGVVFVWLAHHAALRLEWRGFLMIGLLGAFTTFSTFSLEAVSMLQDNRIKAALVYMGGSVTLCTLMAFAGILLARKMLL